MSTPTFRAETYRVELTGSWDVFCLRCHTSIGTFTSDGLRQAIWLTRHKGGIMCPDCRAKSCGGCGVDMTLGGGSMVERYKPGVNLCWPCGLDIETETEALADALPCLVPQNSKKRPIISRTGFDDLGRYWPLNDERLGVQNED